MVSHSEPRRAGVQRTRRPRVDRDGDLVMGAAPVRPTPPRPSHPTHHTEVKVEGWSPAADAKDTLSNLLKFLTRHAYKRRPRTRTPAPPAAIKRHRLEGTDTLYISVPENDAALYTKLNGFTFMGAKLHISRPGHSDSAKAPPQTQNQPEDPASAGTAPGELIEMLQRFLSRRYSADTKLLNLKEMAADPELSTSGMFDTPARQAKFFSALMKVCDDAFTSPQQKRDSITSISLASNGLTNLHMVHALRHTFPDIINLDLSANAFKSTKDLIRWKTNAFPHLDLLLLNDNPLVTSQPGWEQEIYRWFPRLRLLNNIQIRSDAEIARLDMPKETPIPSSETIWQDVDAVAERFLVDFCSGFDTDRAAFLAKYYDAQSSFSLDLNTEIKGGAKQHDKTPWDAYTKYNRNGKSVKSPRTRQSRLYIGSEKIGAVWKDIPPTRHPSLVDELPRYKLECQPISGVPTPNGPLSIGLQVVIHGDFEEHNTVRGANEVVRRNFDRTFVLGAGGLSGVRVVRDHLTLRPYGGVPGWKAGRDGKEGSMEVEVEL